MKVNVKVNTQGNIKAWTEAKKQAVRDAVNESALNIQTGAKRRTVVDTGRLRSSIAIEPATELTGYSLRVGTKVFYGPYIEFGTGVFSNHPTEQGRQTPWAFPVAKASKKKIYNWPQMEMGGEMYYMTRGSKPHPFLFPAFEEERPHFEKRVREALK